MWEFLTTERLLKVIKNTFYFMLKALFVLEIFLCWLLSYVEKRLDKTAKVNIKIYGITEGATNKYKICIAQYFKKWKQSTSQAWSVNKIESESIFLQNSCRKWGREIRTYNKNNPYNTSVDLETCSILIF